MQTFKALITIAFLLKGAACNTVHDNAPGVGGWGGSCTCPDGQVYQVGDNYDSCGSLACVGGTPGACNRHDGAWSRRKVTCGSGSGNVVKDNAPGVGGWGGSCTCPDGQVYQVGDKIDFCASLACYGGTSGTCNRHDGPWSRRQVNCAAAKPAPKPASDNIVEENASGIGGWGGSCTCPDGEVYQVGDNYDSCGSLACVGGTPGTCNRHDGAWSRRKVTCAKPVTEPPTTTTTTTTKPPTTTTTTTTKPPTTTTTTTTKPPTTTTTPPPVCGPQFAVTQGLLPVEDCKSMEVKDDTRACKNMFDGSLSRDVKEGVCFVTKSNYKGWLEVILKQTSTVEKIVMLSKGNGDGLAGAIASVCTDTTKKSCTRFGKVYKVKPEKCTILKPEDGAQTTGKMVRFYISGSNLVICEMKIYGVY